MPTNSNGNRVTKFFVPFTTAAGPTGEYIQFQDSMVDPISALENHVNGSALDRPLFALKTQDRPLSKRQVTSLIASLAKAHNLSNLNDHSLPIGETLWESRST